MALEKQKQKRGKSAHEPLAQPGRKNDVEAFVLHVKENPLLYGAAFLVIVLAALAGLFYRMAREDRNRTVDTSYVRTFETEDPALMAGELSQVDAEGSARADEVAYMAGEAEYKAGNLDKAQENFQKVVDQYPDSLFVAPALEGLGDIARDQGKSKEALEIYRGILQNQKYQGSFTALRQPLNIGEVEEELGNLKEAVAAYTDATTTFPGSNVAKEAQAALDRIRKTNPELFPQPEAAAATAPEAEPGIQLQLPEAGVAPENTAPVTTETVEAPVPETPAAPEPVEAPAPETATPETPATDVVEPTPVVEPDTTVPDEPATETAPTEPAPAQ